MWATNLVPSIRNIPSAFLRPRGGSHVVGIQSELRRFHLCVIEYYSIESSLWHARQHRCCVLSFYGCGTDRPCELLQRSRAPVVPTAVYTSLDSLCQTAMAVARAPPVFLYAMIHQHRCCASVTHRAPKPRLAQLRPRSPVCALTGLAVCPAKFDLLAAFPPGLPAREAFLSEP